MVESNEARQKFAGAKAISSDMFFGREADAEVDTFCSAYTGTALALPPSVHSGPTLLPSYKFFVLFSAAV